jgi:hypothetical protein
MIQSNLIAPNRQREHVLDQFSTHHIKSSLYSFNESIGHIEGTFSKRKLGTTPAMIMRLEL